MKIFGFALASLYFLYCIYSPEWHFISAFDLIIHEAGHTLTPTFILGETATALGGSVFQILVPLTFAVYFYRKQDMFSFSILLMWVAENIANVSRYIADSLALQIPLLGGDGSIHDWNFILGKWNLLVHSEFIGEIFLTLSWIVFVYAFVLGISTLMHKKTSETL